MKTWVSMMRVTYSTVVTVEAVTKDEAIEAFKSGDWLSDRPDEAVDWDDPREVESDD